MPLVPNDTPYPLLSPGDPDPVLVHDAGRRSPFLLTCDHAGKAVPQRLGTLGLSEHHLSDHIGWDPNAWALTKVLADMLGALALGQVYSRLVIDSNRKLTAHDSIATVSDTIPVPGNADVSPQERDARYHQIMLPYQTRVGAELAALRAVGPVHIVSMHTCTKQLRGGTFRPWQVGVISGPDGRMRRPVFERLQAAATGLVIGENEPYIVNMTNDYTLPVHAEAQAIPYVEFEFRNDMFGDEASREEICRMTADALRHAVAELARRTARGGPE